MPTTFNVISLGNYADMDSVEGNNTAEDASSLVGTTFGGPADPLYGNFVSFSPGTGGFSAGSANYYDQDNAPAENFSIDGGTDQVYDSAARYSATITYTDGSTATVNVAIFQDTAGNTYLAPETSQNATQDALEADPIRSLTLDSLVADTTQGLVGIRDSFEYVPCYAPETVIDTPSGQTRVETLRPGSRVLTADHGPQTIRWVHRGECSLEQAGDDAKPVLIKAGALGQNLPVRDLVVSPQHRILVGGGGSLTSVFAQEVFAPAKSLTTLPGIRHMKGKRQITWVHFACDRHEVVLANGCLSESLLLGPMVPNGLPATKRRELARVFGPAPAPGSCLNGPSARDCLTVGAVRRLIATRDAGNWPLGAREIQKWTADLAGERCAFETAGSAPSRDTQPARFRQTLAAFR